jgi:hypothetical protein
MKRRLSHTRDTAAREHWLARNRHTVLWTLIALSIALRVTYFLQLNGTPFIQMHGWGQSDMHYYDRWAREIAGGDWLSASVKIPMHRWHREIAAQYFDAHADVRAELDREVATSNDRLDRDELIWSRWMQQPRFYQDPLYPYLIAVTYRFVGQDVRFVFAWQLALGVLTNVLIWQLTRRYFGDVVAACAGALAVLSGTLVFYEQILLRDSLIVFAGLALIWLTDRALSRGGQVWFGVLGLALGVSCLLKSTFILLAGGIATVMILLFWHRRRELLLSVSAIAAGFLIALSPLAARNVALGVPAFSMASSGPLTFVASNEAGYLPEVGFGINARVLTNFLGETSGGWLPAVREALRTHTVVSYASMLWQKWDRLWHWYAIPNNENFYYMRMQLPALAWLPVTFWFCAPLALVGLVLGAKQFRDAWPLYLLVVSSVVPMVIFYVLARFRIALVAALIPFAALTLVQTVEWVRARRQAPAAMSLACVVLIAGWTGRPLGGHQFLIRMADWILPYSVYYQPRVYSALDARDWSGAAAWYLEFFRYEPTPAQILASNDPSLAPELADMHLECAKILRMSGQAHRAQAQMEKAQHILHLSRFR